MASTITGYETLLFTGNHAGAVTDILGRWANISLNLRTLLGAAVVSPHIDGVKLVGTGGSQFNGEDKHAHIDLTEPISEGRNVVNQTCETAIFEIQNGVNHPEYAAQLNARHDLTILEYGRNKAYIESGSSITLAKCLNDNRTAIPSPHTETTFAGDHHTNYYSHIANYSSFFANDIHDVNATGLKKLITKHMYAYERFQGYPNTIYKSVLQGGALRGTNVGPMNANQIKDAGEAAWNALKSGGHVSRKDVLPYWLKYLKDKKGTMAIFEWNNGIDISWMDYLKDLDDNGLWANSGTHNTNIALAVDALL